MYIIEDKLLTTYRKLGFKTKLLTDMVTLIIKKIPVTTNSERQRFMFV